MQGLAGRLNFTASATSHNASYTDPSLANVNATETDGEQLDASDPRNRFSYAVRKMRFVWKDVAPLLRLAGPGMYLATYIGALLGILLSVYHTWNGIRSSWATYFRAYEMLQTHRQTALRFPLRKANSMRLLSTLVFYHIFGFALTTLIGALHGCAPERPNIFGPYEGIWADGQLQRPRAALPVAVPATLSHVPRV